MKKNMQNILFLIIGVILMCIAIIPLVQLYGDTPIYLEEIPEASIFWYMFLCMFLSINFLNAGISFFLNNGIEKTLSIRRVIYIAIIVFIFLWVFFPRLYFGFLAGFTM